MGENQLSTIQTSLVGHYILRFSFIWSLCVSKCVLQQCFLWFKEKDFQSLFLDLFQAGSETTSTYLETVILFLILHPDVQQKVVQELESVIPSGSQVSHQNMDRMTYTQAFFLEVHRLGKTLFNLVPRKALKDFEYKGFIFRKDTSFLCDLYTAYHTQEFGGERESWKFSPERFISKENGQLNSLSKKVIPFGVGKRSCPGNRLAEISSFLFIVTILQRYKLTTVPGEDPPSTEMRMGFTARPPPFQFCISKRH
jgi:cytochrome P450